MSKSLKRVSRALADLGLDPPVAMEAQTRTAEDAARAVDVEVDQIGKSLLFRGTDSGGLFLFLTAGSNRVDPERAAFLAGEPLGKAGADDVRRVTGFAIGGVSPVGQIAAIPVHMDRRLLDFDVIWCAAGTPHHVFACEPSRLARLIGARIGDFTATSSMM